MFRPTCYLTFTLEGDDLTSAKAAELRRSYSYVAPTKVVAGRREAAEGERPLANAVELELRCGGVEPGDEAWGRDVEPWLRTKLDKLCGTIRECNDPRRRSYAGGARYATLELKLGDRRVTLSIDDEGQPRDLDEALAALRG